jgi:hypothetical protein
MRSEMGRFSIDLIAAFNVTNMRFLQTIIDSAHIRTAKFSY